MVENVVLSLVPRPVITGIIATAIPAAIRPYSIAVAAPSSFRNLIIRAMSDALASLLSSAGKRSLNSNPLPTFFIVLHPYYRSRWSQLRNAIADAPLRIDSTAVIHACLGVVAGLPKYSGDRAQLRSAILRCAKVPRQQPSSSYANAPNIISSSLGSPNGS